MRFRFQNDDCQSAELQVFSSTRMVSFAVAFALLASVMAIAAKNMIVDIDLFHEMALYRQMESQGEMPRTDDFAYTPTIEPVVHHEWATGAVLYLATVTAGWGATGLIVIKYLLTLGVCAGCFFYAYRQGAGQATIALLAPIALNVGGWMAFTNIRAQLFTLFFLVVMYFLLEQDRKGKRWWVIAWIPLFILWANMHGGVVSGMGLLGVYCLSRVIVSWRETRSIEQTIKNVAHLVVIGVGTILLLYVNPYGTDYAPYLIRAVRMDRPTIIEWWPIYKVKLPVFYTISVLIAAYGIWQRGKEHIFETLAICLTAYLAFKHYRHGSLYAVTWACFVPPMIQSTNVGDSIKRLWNSYGSQVAVASLAIGFVATGVCIHERCWELRIPNQKSANQRNVATFPVGAVDFLKEKKFTGNVLVSFPVGAYVSWKLFPHVKVSLDSRYEVAYPPGAMEEDEQFYTAAKGWQDIPARQGANAILVPNEYPLAKVIQQETESIPVGFPWKCVYRDQGYAIYMPLETAADLVTVDRRNEFITGVFP